MASYEFECHECRKKFEVHQSFDEHDHQPKPKCPECGSRRVERQLEAVHVQTSKKS